MADKSLRGRGMINRQGFGPQTRSKRRIKSFEEEVNAGPSEALGIHVSGGGEKKPHSTKSGRLSAARNLLNRAWGQKYINKKKGTPV